MHQLISGLVVLFFLVNCTKAKLTYQEFVGEAQGTTFYISYLDSNSTDYSGDIEKILQDFDKQLSTYLKGSVINQFNDNEIDSIVISSNTTELARCFKESIGIQKYTDGYFNHGLQNLIRANQYSSYSEGVFNKEIRDSILAISSVLIINNQSIKKVDSRSQFNFNAIAQGLSVDVLCEFFDSKGVNNYMVEIGGEVRVRGRNPEGKFWTISLEAPNSTREDRVVQETISVENKSVVTSGSYRKFKEINGMKYSHAINPKTGLGVTHNLLSVSVVCEKASVADGLATAFLVMGKEKTIRLLDSNNRYNVSLLFIESDSDGNFNSFYYGGFEKLIVK